MQTFKEPWKPRKKQTAKSENAKYREKKQPAKKTRFTVNNSATKNILSKTNLGCILEKRFIF